MSRQQNRAKAAGLRLGSGYPLCVEGLLWDGKATLYVYGDVLDDEVQNLEMAMINILTTNPVTLTLDFSGTNRLSRQALAAIINCSLSVGHLELRLPEKTAA